MTQNTFIWALNSVQKPFCRSLLQRCHTTVFRASNLTGLSNLLRARGVAHSHRITDLSFVYFSAGGLAYCGCQSPDSMAHIACCCFLSVGIHISSPPHKSIQFLFQLDCGVCLMVNEGICTL